VAINPYKVSCVAFTFLHLVGLSVGVNLFPPHYQQQVLPIYTPDMLKTYRDRPASELPPHIFSIANAAYSSMRNEGIDQAIIIR